MQNPFTEKLQSLLGKTNTAQITLAKGVGKSNASISKILNGKAIPTSETYCQIRDFLKLNDKDEEELDRAYILLHTPDIGKTKALSYKAPQKYIQGEANDSYQYLDANKALLRRHVETILKELGIHFDSNHVEGSIASDFLIDHKGKRIALICSRHAQYLEGADTMEAMDWVNRFKADGVWYVTTDLTEFFVYDGLFSVSILRFKELLAQKLSGPAPA